MKFVADESVDQPIVERLRADGHDVLAVAEMEPGLSDDAVIERANREAALLLTADKDFGELVYRQGRHAQGIILVRLAGLSPVRKGNILAAAIRDHGGEIPASFTVVSHGAVRVRRRRS